MSLKHLNLNNVINQLNRSLIYGEPTKEEQQELQNEFNQVEWDLYLEKGIPPTKEEVVKVLIEKCQVEIKESMEGLSSWLPDTNPSKNTIGTPYFGVSRSQSKTGKRKRRK